MRAWHANISAILRVFDGAGKMGMRQGIACALSGYEPFPGTDIGIAVTTIMENA